MCSVAVVMSNFLLLSPLFSTFSAPLTITTEMRHAMSMTELHLLTITTEMRDAMSETELHLLTITTEMRDAMSMTDLHLLTITTEMRDAVSVTELHLLTITTEMQDAMSMTELHPCANFQPNLFREDAPHTDRQTDRRSIPALP